MLWPRQLPFCFQTHPHALSHTHLLSGLLPWGSLALAEELPGDIPTPAGSATKNCKDVKRQEKRKDFSQGTMNWSRWMGLEELSAATLKHTRSQGKGSDHELVILVT